MTITPASTLERTIRITDQPPVVLGDMIDADDCQLLIDFYRRVGPSGDRHDERYGDSDETLGACSVPLEFVPAFRSYALAVGGLFGLPVAAADVDFALARYTTGGFQDWHCDANVGDDLGRDRTVSYSLLLSEPGIDFEGGDLEFAHDVPSLHKGDLVAFTSRSIHRVKRVTAGERFVVICFGSCPPRVPEPR